MIEWETVCLVCLQKGENRCIFGEDNDSNIIADKIMKCVDALIKRETNQPRKICLKCLDDLNVAYKFLQDCDQSHSIIKGLQNTNNLEFEIKDLWKTTPVAVNPTLDICVKDEIIDNAVVDDSYENTLPLDLKDDPDTETKLVADNVDACINNNAIELNNVEANESSESKKQENCKISKRPEVLLKKSEKKSPKICEICGHSFKFQSVLNYHMRRHNNERPFSCGNCDKAFVSSSELGIHMRVHTGQKPHKCQYCDRRFAGSGNRKIHERTHTGERPFVCSICGSSFTDPHALKRHLKSHTGEKRTVRKKRCKTGERKNSTIKAVQNTNNQKVKIKDLWKTAPVAVNPTLDICIKDEIMNNAVVGDVYENTLPLDLKDDPDTETKFFVKDNADACVRDNAIELNNVEATEGNKIKQKIKYEISRSSRGRSKKLTAESRAMPSQIVDNAVVVETHENTHRLDLENDPDTGVKFVVYPTDEHSKTEELNSMEADENSETEKEVSCGISKRSKLHSKKSKKKPPKICKICGQRCKVQSLLDIHMRRHNNERPFSCGNCDKAFVSRSELGMHMRIHTGQKPHKCQYCDRRFTGSGNRKSHERIHTGERPFLCSICGSPFAHRNILKRHLQSHTGEKKPVHKKRSHTAERGNSNSKEFSVNAQVGDIKEEID